MDEDENVFPVDITEREAWVTTVEVSARRLPRGDAVR